jgi:thiol-disulfide isomerase/thioredoxin
MMLLENMFRTKSSICPLCSIRRIWRFRWFVFSFVVLLSGVAVLVGLRTPTSVEWSTDLAAARREAIIARKPLLLDVSAKWCGPCQRMKLTTLRDAAVVQALTDYVPVMIDIDVHPEIADGLNVNSIPAFFIADPITGRIQKENRQGWMLPHEFLAWLRSDSDSADSERFRDTGKQQLSTAR